MSEEKKEVNRFSRGMVIIVFILILSLIITNFYVYDPTGIISNGILVLLGFLIILSLAEVFDQLALGKFISLKKNFKEKEKENKSLKDENTGLRDQLIQITANLSQSQAQSNHVTVQNDTNNNLLEKLFDRIISANIKEVEEKNKQEQEDLNTITKSIEPKATKRRYDWSRIEDFVIKKTTLDLGISNDEIISNIKLTSSQTSQDPISNHQVLFDAYIPGREIFIEVRPNNISTPIFRDRLYSMISKLMYYSWRLRNKKALLILVLVDINDGEENRRKHSIIDKIFEEFDPAIRQDFLVVRLETIEQSDIDNFIKE